ncbi:MAG TPA: VOC family protein [Gemmatimonadales bacterium]|jgi:uncharacterized glyoxalase superfamily protein PhnB
MIINRSAPASTVVPVLTYDDVGAAIDWLCAAFGFAERLRGAGPGDTVSHAQLSFGNGDVMLGTSKAGFNVPRPGDLSVYVHVRVEDVEMHYARTEAFAAKILLPLATYPYGERQYTVEDIGGHRWTFSQSVEDIDPATWATVVKPG